MHPADLLADLAVRPEGGGRYTVDLLPSWSFLYPSGGVLMSLALSAMRAELADPELPLVSATATFCAPVAPGRITVDVTVLRRGRAASQLRAQLRPSDSEHEGLEVSATFARVRPGPDVIDTALPALPRPDEAPDEKVHAGRILQAPFFQNFDLRIAEGRPWFDKGWTPDAARFARWFRYLKTPRLPDGTIDPLAVPPVADTMPPALYMKLGPDHPPLYCPSLDLTIHFIEPARTDWLLVRSHCRRARAGWATADAEVWDEDARLVAVATQTMMLREGLPGSRRRRE